MMVCKPFAVRAADIDDLAILIDLEAAAFGAASWGGEGVRTALIAEGNQTILALSDDGRPVGFAIWRVGGDEAEILTIGVDPGEQRSGIATELLSAVFEELTRNAVADLFLEVDGGNGAAIALYEKSGFETVGARKAYYRNVADALIMRHTLNSSP